MKNRRTRHLARRNCTRMQWPFLTTRKNIRSRLLFRVNDELKRDESLREINNFTVFMRHFTIYLDDIQLSIIIIRNYNLVLD